MAEKTEKDKMLSGELYRGNDKGLLDDRRHAQQLLSRYNSMSRDGHLRAALLRDLFDIVGRTHSSYLLSPVTTATITVLAGMSSSTITAYFWTARPLQSEMTYRSP